MNDQLDWFTVSTEYMLCAYILKIYLMVWLRQSGEEYDLNPQILNFLCYFRGPTSVAQKSYFCYFYHDNFFLRVVLNCVFYSVFENHDNPTVDKFCI